MQFHCYCALLLVGRQYYILLALSWQYPGDSLAISWQYPGNVTALGLYHGNTTAISLLLWVIAGWPAILHRFALSRQFKSNSQQYLGNIMVIWWQCDSNMAIQQEVHFYCSSLLVGRQYYICLPSVGNLRAIVINIMAISWQYLSNIMQYHAILWQYYGAMIAIWQQYGNIMAKPWQYSGNECNLNVIVPYCWLAGNTTSYW
jgi:hypothetical protein